LASLNNSLLENGLEHMWQSVDRPGMSRSGTHRDKESTACSPKEFESTEKSGPIRPGFQIETRVLC
jgi:hypothetical protein